VLRFGKGVKAWRTRKLECQCSDGNLMLHRVDDPDLHQKTNLHLE
jgi:hypothetical protein